MAQILESRRWSRTDATTVIEAWRASRLSCRAFCERHALDPQRIARWAKQLERTPTLAEVVVVGEAARPQSVIVIELGPARVVVDHDVDDDHLARVVRVVGSVC